MKFKVFVVLVLTLGLALLASAQKLDKPYNKWSKDEAIKIITESAWAKTYQSTKGTDVALAGQNARLQNQTATRGGSDPRSVARDLGPAPVVMRLHSALPVRQALVRLQQIDAGYDKMNEADRATFDKSREKFLECAICKDYYVVTITKFVDSTGQVADEGIFQGFTLEELKGNVRLVNDKGVTRDIVQFNSPKNARDQAVFYFKRTDETGQPLLTPDSKEVKFVFTGDFLSTKNRFAYLVPNTFEFKISKMIADNTVLF